MAAAFSITFDFINSSVGQATSKDEAMLRETLLNIGDNPSAADMLMLQQRIQQWTMFMQIQSTIIKEVADAMKGVIQKAG